MNHRASESEITQAPATLAERFTHVRELSKRLREPLEPEDCCIQSMPDVSPTRWHLAHTTWFFEEFVLSRLPGYQPWNDQYTYLFNSYYNAVSVQFPRARRGLLSRPTVGEVMDYREVVDARMQRWLERDELLGDASLPGIVELGINHEQQHQELMLTDIKHVFSCNPLWPVYRAGQLARGCSGNTVWTDFDEGMYRIGHEGSGFAYDNESPRHRVVLEHFQIANRPVTCGEYREFVEDGGYQRPELWLAEGWAHVCEQGWRAPLYWVEKDGGTCEFTLAGLVPLDDQRPVCHTCYFEADAFARWRGARLPTEAEWEVASASVPVTGNFVEVLMADGEAIHPSARSAAGTGPVKLFGDVWEWTASSYSPYPGYRPAAGALGEYNGKFMCNQYVLRGGSCATPTGHIRRTYRNFFPAHARWQFSGIRLAR